MNAWNPALEPEPVEPSSHRYRVLGTRVLGHDRGDEFEQTLDPAQEARLIASGALERLDETDQQDAGETPATPDASSASPDESQGA